MAEIQNCLTDIATTLTFTGPKTNSSIA